MRQEVAKRLWFAYFVLLLTWGLLAYAEIGRYMTQGVLFARVLGGRPYINDFVNVYNAGVLAKRSLSQKLEIYDISVQAESAAALVAPVKPELPFYLQYPPQFFLLMLPLSLFSMPWAWGFWVAINLVAIVYAARWLLQDVGGRFAKSFGLVAILSSYPAWLSVELGQTSMPLLPLAVWYFASLLRSKTVEPAAGLALMSIKIQYLPFFAAVGGALSALSGRASLVKFATMTAACLLGLLCLCGLILGWGNVVGYLGALTGGETGAQVSGVNPHEMQNLRGVLSLMVNDTRLVMVVSLVGCALSGLYTLWLWWQLRRTAKTTEFRDLACIAFALTILAMLSFGPHTHTQDYLLTAISCVFIWKYSGSLAARRLVLAFPAVSWIFFILRGLFNLVWIQPFFLWAVVLLVVGTMDFLKGVERRSRNGAAT